MRFALSGAPGARSLDLIAVEGQPGKKDNGKDDDNNTGKLFIDPNECIDCGACEPECPVNAIFPEESVPTEWAGFTQIDATWYTDKAAARAAVDEHKPA